MGRMPLLITASAYRKLLQVPQVPPETGGILGMKNGMISEVYLDTAKPVLGRAMYIPDVNVLNRQIGAWQNNSVEFAGLFHSHPPDQKELSRKDEIYAVEILKAMPDTIRKLFFPIIIPGQAVIAFSAVRQNDHSVAIIRENVHLIETGGNQDGR